MNILVVIEDSRGLMHRMSKEAIAGAQKIGGSITALVIGENADAISNELSSLAIKKTLVVKHELVSSYNSDGYTEIVTQVIESTSPDMLVMVTRTKLVILCRVLVPGSIFHSSLIS